MSIMWQRLYSKWKDLRSQERNKKQKLDFASAALILLQTKKPKKRLVQFSHGIVVCRIVFMSYYGAALCIVLQHYL